MGNAIIPPPSGSPFRINLINPAAANLNPVAPSPSVGFCNVVAGGACDVLMPIEVVRYQIAQDPADATVPALWRSRTGRFDSTGIVATPPGGNWEMVARGIEDLQVEYWIGGPVSGAGAGAYQPNPGNVFCTSPCTSPVVGAGPLAADFNRIVRQVRITISARSTAPALVGMTTAGGGAGAAVRGSAVAVIAPRAALQALTATPGATNGWY
jgi:hypothetical protein